MFNASSERKPRMGLSCPSRLTLCASSKRDSTRRRCASSCTCFASKGDTSPATEWLREGVQRHGGLREPRATIALACGFEPSEGPLLDYLEAKFGALYGL